MLAQTAVRGAGVGHAQANVALLPASARRRSAAAGPSCSTALDAQLALPFAELAALLRTRTGGEGLRALAADADAARRARGAPPRSAPASCARIPPAPTPTSCARSTWRRQARPDADITSGPADVLPIDRIMGRRAVALPIDRINCYGRPVVQSGNTTVAPPTNSAACCANTVASWR